MRVLPQLCFQCHSWFQPKTVRKVRFCCNACRQSHYRGNRPYLVKFDLTECSDESAKKFHELIKRYDSGGDLYDCLNNMREHNFELYSRFIYNYSRDKFGVTGHQFVKGKQTDLL